MYRSIMVPLDGSRAAEHALPLAISIARRAGATLQLAHIHDVQGSRTLPAGLARCRAL
jgi:nucleotide-binding universal stress UspA family protein